MTSHGVLRLPERILFGSRVRDNIAEIVQELGTRAFVVVDPFLQNTAEFQSTMTALRNRDVSVRVYPDVAPELPVASLDDAARFATEFGPDVIVGYGGGSALDAAKLVALLVTHGAPLSNYYGENAVPGPVLPIVAIPTTSGTGSEVTPVAVISDPDREMKVGISSPHLVPRRAIVDPDLTMALPASVTAFSGIDAFVHAVESYTSRQVDDAWPDANRVFVGQNVLSNPLSLEAIRAITPALPRAFAQPGDPAARADMSRGSLLAGMAFGSTGTHLSHALQYPIGALTHTPHGLGTGFMLPYVLQAAATKIPEKLRDIGLAMRLDDTSPEAVVEAVEELGRSIGLPASLKEIGISDADLPRIAELAMRSARLVNIAPISANPESLEIILRAALVGDRALISKI